MRYLFLLLLVGCQAIESRREPTRLDCTAGCTGETCTASVSAVGKVATRDRKITLDTPTQTKVGIKDE